MPWSALSSTLVVGVISFPMNCPKILGFLWLENRRRLSHAHPTAAVPVALCSECFASVSGSQTSAIPINPPCGFPLAQAALELDAQPFQPQRKPSPPLPSVPGNYSVSWHKPLCLLFKTSVSIPSFPCLLRPTNTWEMRPSLRPGLEMAKVKLP